MNTDSAEKTSQSGRLSPHRLDRPPHRLEMPFSIGERAVFFRIRARGQHHMRFLRGLRQKQFLTDQKFQLLQSLLNS
jgi:hypothetical protein